MDHEVGPWKRAFSVVRVHDPTPMVRHLKKHVLKALGPSLGVIRMCTTKNDHAPKNACIDFFDICPKRAFLEKIQVCPFYCLLMGFTCLQFLLNVLKMWLANLFTTIFTIIMSNFICTCSNLHVTCTLCCTLSIICNPLHHVYSDSNSWVLDVPHCLMKHVGASWRGRAWKKWYVSWAMIWSRHMEGGLVSQDSIHHIYAKSVPYESYLMGRVLHKTPKTISLKNIL